MAILENILIEIYSHVKSCRYFPKMKNTPKSGKKSEQNAGGACAGYGEDMVLL